MASLLAKFRIDYSDLQLISDITTKPLDTTQQYFDSVIKDFIKPDQEAEHGSLHKFPFHNSSFQQIPLPETITEADLLAVQDKTNRHLRLREYLLEHSSTSDLVVMTLPMPRKNIVSAPLYMAWLECLSRDQPPFLFVRGNQSSVLTFYS